MKVAVTNVVLSNSGDAAILRGIVQALVEEGVTSASEVTVFDSNSDATRDLYPDLHVVQLLTSARPSRVRGVSRVSAHFRRAISRRLGEGSRAWDWLMRRSPFRASNFGRAYTELAKADLVVSTGGTYLVDHYDFSMRAEELRIASRLGKPVYLWTQSMGPFESEAAKASIRQIAELADGVYFRDAKSAQHWNAAVGMRVPGAVVADAAFAIRPPAVVGEDRDRVLLSVREWNHAGPTGEPFDEYRYFEGFRDAARSVAARGLHSVAMSTCQGIEGYVDDSTTARACFSGMDVAIDSNFHSPEELIQQIAQSTLVVTTRMHLAILSLVVGVPVIAIAYEFKTLELFAGLGLDKYVVAIDEVSPETLSVMVREALDDPGAARLSAAAREAVRSSARLPARDIAKQSLVATT